MIKYIAILIYTYVERVQVGTSPSYGVGSDRAIYENRMAKKELTCEIFLPDTMEYTEALQEAFNACRLSLPCSNYCSVPEIQFFSLETAERFKARHSVKDIKQE